MYYTSNLFFSRENADSQSKLKIAGLAGSNFKSQTTPNEVVKFKSEFEIENREEHSTCSQSNEHADTSSSASQVLATGRRPRGRPRKDSGATHKYKSIRSTQSSLMRLLKGRPSRTVPQTLIAAKRFTRFAAAQKATRTSNAEEEPADQMLLSLGLKKVSSASNKPNGSELSLRESPLPSILADASNAHRWSADRVSELVTDVLRDVGIDEATVAAVRVEFAREAIDGVAFARLGQQELSQRFGPTCGLALRVLSSALSQLSAASFSSPSDPSRAADTTVCGESEATTTSTAVSDSYENLGPPADSATAPAKWLSRYGITIVAFHMR